MPITKENTIKGRVEEFARVTGIKKSHIKHIHKGDDDLRERARMSLLGTKLADGDTVVASIRALHSCLQTTSQM